SSALAASKDEGYPRAPFLNRSPWFSSGALNARGHTHKRLAALKSWSSAASRRHEIRIRRSDTGRTSRSFLTSAEAIQLYGSPSPGRPPSWCQETDRRPCIRGLGTA